MPVEIVGIRDNPCIVPRDAEASEFAPVLTGETILARQGYTVGIHLLSREFSQLIPRKYVPKQLMEKYLRGAMKRASQRQFEDDTWYAEIPGFEGVWSNEESLQDCLNVLEEVLLDWLLLKIEGEDKDIPVVDGIDLNAIQ